MDSFRIGLRVFGVLLLFSFSGIGAVYFDKLQQF